MSDRHMALYFGSSDCAIPQAVLVTRSHSRDMVFIPAQYMFDLWSTMWHWDRLFSNYYGLPIKYNSTNTLILYTNHLKLTQLAQHRYGPSHPTPRVTQVIRLACEFGLHVWLNRWSDYLAFIANKFWTKDSQCSRWFILSPHSIRESWATYSEDLRFSQHFCRRLKPSEM
jgi:hypothetical protein